MAAAFVYDATMRLTVCQLRDDRVGFAADWEWLAVHVREQRSDLVILPEFPFATWFAIKQPFDAAVWRDVVAAHEAWDKRLGELAPAAVIATRPAERGGQRFNEAFAATPDGARTALHDKRYLPEEPGYFEASWYQRGDGSFTPANVAGARVGMQVCSELWVLDVSRAYAAQDVDLIAVPRATPASSVEKWLLAGRTASIVAGAFSASSNHAGDSPAGFTFAGAGWIIDPEGEVLARTSDEAPFATVEIDLAKAREAKQTYPRYIR